ncbi:unnamed protein product [Paramecium octaurelia]|uniref:Uncharacterized protein n=1 Tax=Paramecium octaurelia TaxID=43137 RepID=A0A8S1WEW0_PAROT|nr:unnamed protein product [Paramecium octaurelia]
MPFTHDQKEGNMKNIGLITNNKEKVDTYYLMGSVSQECGINEEGQNGWIFLNRALFETQGLQFLCVTIFG